MSAETGHGITYHGGFNVSDKVEVREGNIWIPGIHVIERFDGMSVLVGLKDGSAMIVSIYDIRHPHLAKEVHKRHGGRS